MKRPARSLLALLLALVLAGCAGAGPYGGAGGGQRPRCGSSAQDDQRPLFFIFCVESP